MSNTITIKPIRTKADHAAALKEIESLWNAKPGTAEHDKLDVLATLVVAYEKIHTPMLPPDPIEAILFRLEQQGMKRKDLEPIIGTRSRVSEILSGKRTLTLPMIRELHRELDIPLDILIAESDGSYTMVMMKGTPEKRAPRNAGKGASKAARPPARSKGAPTTKKHARAS